MKKAIASPYKTRAKDTEMRAEYDFRGGIRGRYAARYAEGSNLVLLAPDVAEAFPNAEAVNAALRLMLKAAQKSVVRAKVKAGS